MNLPFQPGQVVQENGVRLICTRIEQSYSHGSLAHFRVELEGYADISMPAAVTALTTGISVDPEQIKDNFGKVERKLAL